MDQKEVLRAQLTALQDQFAAEKATNRGSPHSRYLRKRIRRVEEKLAGLSNARVEPSTINVKPDIGL